MMVRFLFTIVTVFHALLVYYCHVASCFASGLLLSQVRFTFTTCHVRILSQKSIRCYCLSFIIMYLFFFLPVYYCFICLFDTVILSQQGSLLFTTRVLLYTKQNDPCHGFFITEIRLSYFHNFFINFVGSIKDQIV